MARTFLLVTAALWSAGITAGIAGRLVGTGDGDLLVEGGTLAAEGTSAPAVPAPAAASADGSGPWLAVSPLARGATPAPADDEPLERPCDRPVRDGRRLVALRARIVDAESGREVVGAVWEPAAPAEATAPDGPRIRVEDPDRTSVIDGKVTTPPGLLAWDAARRCVAVSRFASSLLLVYPLRREADVEVEVRDAEGAVPASADLAADVFAADRSWEETVVLDRHGRLRVAGIPFFRGGAWTVTVRESRESWGRSASVGGVLPYEHGIPVRGTIVLPELAEAFEGPSCNECIACGGCGGCGGRVVCAERIPEGRVALRVRRRDGAPAVGAKVELWPVGAPANRCGARVVLDAEGRGLASGVGAGLWSVRMGEPGLVPATSQVTVRAGETAEVDLREDEGGEVLALVVDADGRPLPHAAVELRQPSGAAWADLEGDVQRVDPWTDAWGRRLLARVEPGKVRVSASYGGRKAAATVVVETGRRTPARLVLE